MPTLGPPYRIVNGHQGPPPSAPINDANKPRTIEDEDSSFSMPGTRLITSGDVECPPGEWLWRGRCLKGISLTKNE